LLDAAPVRVESRGREAGRDAFAAADGHRLEGGVPRGHEAGRRDAEAGRRGEDGGIDAADAGDATVARDGGLLPDALPDRGAGAYLSGRPEVLCATSDPPSPPTSTAIPDAAVELADSIGLPSTGDLWPSCWSGDALYAAWGDGFGFSDAGAYRRPSIGVARITGYPSPGAAAMTGETLVHDDERSQATFKVWSGAGYYQKPTGMLCTPGRMFLAVQDLDASNYGDAPAATIAVSTDSGRSWSEGTAPMFDDHEFTTIMFLDYGQDSASAVDGYIYVYGLDYNWRWSDTTIPPQGLYLARVGTALGVLDRATWEYFGGMSDGAPVWVTNFGDRLPVLVDCTRRYATSTFEGYTVISQGGVVYDPSRRRYLYTSWSEYTFEFYEAPQPWGPWTKFLYLDFGLPPWTPTHNGGYGTTVPSRFMSQDAGTMWLQSNTWSSGVDENNFALRTLSLGAR
jgi:hypothetical protein